MKVNTFIDEKNGCLKCVILINEENIHYGDHQQFFKKILDKKCNVIELDLQNVIGIKKSFIGTLTKFIDEASGTDTKLKIILKPSLIQWYLDLKGVSLLEHVRVETNYDYD
jgi:hypothetical protein